MPTAQEVVSAITEIEAIAGTILKTIEVTIPVAAAPAAITDQLLTLIGDLASKAVAAWSAAGGTPIDEASIRALMPNPAPLTPPDPGEVSHGPGLHTLWTE